MCQNINLQFFSTSNFEVSLNIIVITKATNTLTMQAKNVPSSIDEEQILDVETAKQLARVVQFLLNIED